jgi:hypothetical protein
MASTGIMTWFQILLGVVAALAGIRYLVRLRAGRSAEPPPTVDDDAVRQILETGTLRRGEGLDMRAISRAEEDFWAEPWDEPEEYPR